jgi:hypothetical protein
LRSFAHRSERRRILLDDWHAVVFTTPTHSLSRGQTGHSITAITPPRATCARASRRSCRRRG